MEKTKYCSLCRGKNEPFGDFIKMLWSLTILISNIVGREIVVELKNDDDRFNHGTSSADLFIRNEEIESIED